MSRFVPTIGLEIHAELRTVTKMFCGCLNDPEEHQPNINVCPVCLGHPGALPTINREAVNKVISVGLALGGKIGNVSKFDRKSYFYPDLPKSYQISQYDEPLVIGGSLKGVRLTRIHLEEDTGRLSHQLPGTVGRDQDYSYVDFNRSGMPLMELVTEPDIKSAEQALEFAKELQLILRYLGASDADMEKGQMRVEANLSIAEPGAKLGTKVEVKNLNSFRAVRDAIKYEIERQTKILEGGGKVIQETRGWDERGVTVSQRLKEQAHDYRYMPEPDLPPMLISDKEIEELRTNIPELPEARRVRFINEYKLDEVQSATIVDDLSYAEFFEEAASELKAAAEDINARQASFQLLANYLLSDLRGLMQKKGVVDMPAVRDKVPPANFAYLIALVAANKVSSRTAKDTLAEMLEKGIDPREILESNSLLQIQDESQLASVVDKIVESAPRAVADYKRGRTTAIEALVGKAMGELKGRGNPEVLRKLFADRLSR
ncbi:MAG: Asp-tRNA(Asn)/Glu-tRNA(Gln) amidotransferase subunit GatB [Patescibacteria group bacterium]|nr:Asp-tRNA(Asn)/Glu-tRNA(Gln) amidotransferase subunit GatB [Patescibacteria group bacterium]MCL5224288.1 Asp-tRNA(Asn)/Glu-tRNA(Gln) amidotransferase subunit GatB [Patescibacteria group bacterium]